MKHCIPVVEEEYDGELRFSITETSIGPNACILTLGGYDGEELVGFQISIPLLTRRFLFKSIQLIPPSGTVKVSSVGEKSDRLIGTLKKYFQPSYEPTDGFTKDEVEIDYNLRNQGGYDINQDKIFLRLFYDEEQDADLPKAERIRLRLDFAFNLSRETASLIETRPGYSADLISFFMK